MITEGSDILQTLPHQFPITRAHGPHPRPVTDPIPSSPLVLVFSRQEYNRSLLTIYDALRCPTINDSSTISSTSHTDARVLVHAHAYTNVQTARTYESLIKKNIFLEERMRASLEEGMGVTVGRFLIGLLEETVVERFEIGRSR